MGAAGSISKSPQGRHRVPPPASLSASAALVQPPVGSGGGASVVAADASLMGDFQALRNRSTPHNTNPSNGPLLMRVAQDGSGHFRSVQAAIDALPLPNRQRVVISVAPGLYRQPVYVPKQKNCITLQDTAYLHYGRQYFRDCYIEGSVDFIFGNAQVLLEHCHIHCKSAGFITAQSCRSAEEPTGYVFLRCVITGTGSAKPYMHLGRPWQPCARVVFACTFMDGCIVPAGWNNWNDREKERTACFCEYRCTGPGSSLAQRVTWMRQLTEADAAKFLSVDFVDPQRTWLTRPTHTAGPYTPVPLSA